MKIVDRATFLTLPPGIVFLNANEYEPGRTICIKDRDKYYENGNFAGTYAIQLGLTDDISTICVDPPADTAPIWEAMKTDIYNAIVFEADDVRKLRDLLTDALKMTGGEA